MDLSKYLSSRTVCIATAVLTIAVLSTACTSGEKSASTTSTDKTETSGTSDEATDSTLARYAGYKSSVYGDPSNWLCRPDSEDICDSGLNATVVDADGTLTLQPWTASPEAPIDCFYVYPTISQDATTFSDMDASDDQEGFAALNQVARLGADCRVFAPVYRQRTLAGLAGVLGNTDSPPVENSGDSAKGSDQVATTSSTADSDALDKDTPYKDVLDAWKSYMANENKGRGVVLIGHSQGAALLNQLIKEEIDPNDDVRDHLVAAYLAGWSVQIPEGKDVGGDFKNIALCRKTSDTGCVVTWSSFRSTAPPPADSLFGRSSTDKGGHKLVSGCNSPASLDGKEAEAISYFPSSPGASIISALGADTGDMTAWVDPSAGTVTTPFVTTPGLVSVECRSDNDITYQALIVHGDPSDPRADDIGGDLTPQWGMHLQDVNVVMGNIVDLVADQSDAYNGRN